ncbi:MAG: hypothetical protein ACREHD_03610 [Pirellulales bacterium]
MPRRFQFSLRALLGLGAVVCLLLGGRHLVETYATYIEVSNSALDEPISIKGRIVRLFGPPKIYFDVNFKCYNAETPSFSRTAGGWVDRSWLCCYNFYDTSPIEMPGNWVVEAELSWYPGLRGDKNVALRKTFNVAVDEAVVDE